MVSLMMTVCWRGYNVVILKVSCAMERLQCSYPDDVPYGEEATM